MFPLHELGEWDLSWLMTIHRAQGSEYRRISVIMAGADKASGEHTNLSGRSLLYTALTRAREHVHLFASEQEIRRLLTRARRNNLSPPTPPLAPQTAPPDRLKYILKIGGIERISYNFTEICAFWRIFRASECSKTFSPCLCLTS